jgi:hypothetical protein
LGEQKIGVHAAMPAELAYVSATFPNEEMSQASARIPSESNRQVGQMKDVWQKTQPVM